MKDTAKKGAKASESAIAEGLRDKSMFNSKDMHKPGSEKSQRPAKGSDRI